MSLLQVKVRFDGSHFIGSLPSPSRGSTGGYREKTRKIELFEQFYHEARKKNIPDRKICEYVENRIMQECDIEDWLLQDEVKALYKRHVTNLHKRIRRYEDKLFWLDPNYYVTFTYSDAKETRESFEARLLKTFSNFKTRHGWLCIVVPEEGKKNGRLHYHCFLKIPKNGMVGELFLNCKYSSKSRKREYFTDNTYFSARFGQSDWHKITRADLVGGGLRSYLTKYLSKSENKIFYSRGIPTELEMVIDTESDVFCTYYDFGFKTILFDHVIYGEAVEAVTDCAYSWEMEAPGFNTDHYLQFGEHRSLRWSDDWNAA